MSSMQDIPTLTRSTVKPSFATFEDSNDLHRLRDQQTFFL